MPLVNGEFKPLRVFEKHGSVLLDQSRKWRYRALYGGRGAGKDWITKMVIVEMAIRRPIRVLFARELMNSIKDSSHQLIKDTISRLGYDKYFHVLENEVRGKNGSLFLYKGIRSNTEEIKSLEGIDICVLDEAQPITEESFNIIDPTIRRVGSEIWFLFNVLMDTDFVYRFCVTDLKRDNMISALVNYTDNPECPEELIEQARQMKEENEPMYRNVWLGEPRSIGLHFTEFGTHNRCHPFIIPEQDDNSGITASLDHGIAHNTSFGLWYLSPDGHMYRIFTYSQNGGTTESHAIAICEAIESCRLSRYLYPCEVFYDYAMDTKHKINEQVYISDLDVYKQVFANRLGARDTLFIPANKRKVDGCHAMKQVFSIGNGEPIFRYFDGLNDALEVSIKAMVSDKINPEMYSKMDGDDETDECRYGVMGNVSKMSAAIATKRKSEPFHVPQRPVPGRKTKGLR